MANEKITLHVYDISGGLAASLSQMFLGIPLEGVWHTGVFVHGKEYFFGGGIKAMHPETFWEAHNIKGPTKTHDLGVTAKTADELHDFIETIKTKYRIDNYDLFKNNCNNFSDDVVRFLKDIDESENAIPDYIIELPNKVLSTPLGRNILGPMLSSIKDGTQLLGKNQNQLQAIFRPGGGAGTQTPVPDISIGQPKVVSTPTITNRDARGYSSIYATLVKAHGEELVDFFEKMKNLPNKGYVQVTDRLGVSNFDCNLDEVGKSCKTFVLVFDKTSSEKEQTTLKEQLSSRNIDGYEVNEVENEHKDELIDLGMSILESIEKKEKITILSKSGNNLILSLILGYLMNIENMTVKESLLKVRQNFKNTYISLENLITIFEYCQLQTKWTRLVEDLHLESKSNILAKYLQPKVKEIMDLNLENVTEKQALTVLKTAKGSTDAAVNLLLT